MYIYICKFLGRVLVFEKKMRENDISDKNSHKMCFSFIGNELEGLFGGKIYIVKY